jgi:signal transduction histidine kinase
MVANKHFDVLQTFNKENHFVADNIYSTIVSDTLVLVGTEEGLMIIKKKSLITGKPDYLQWSEQDGLIDNIIRFIALGHQSIWAFTDNGYSIIPLNQLFRTKVKPKGYIKKLEVNDSLTQLNTKLSLPHNQTKLTIHVGFLSFNNKVLKIRYRLNALNPWIISKDRILQFSSVAPGDYNLEVEYSIDNVNWHPTNITLPFTVAFPWWLRWYSIVSGAGIILIIAILFFRRRLNLQKKQNELLHLINRQQTELVHAEVIISEKERKRLAKELHDSIGTQLTAIKLNVVNILNNRNQPDDLKKIDTHLQHTIDEVRSMAYSLTPPEIERYGLFTALSNHFDKITQTSGIRVDFSTYGDDIQTNELSISIFRILQELSSNTLKHTKAKNIKITINSFEQTVNVLYEDDGGGFAPEKVKNGLGLSNITSRVGAIGGTSNFESTAFGVSYVFEFPKNEL